MKFDDKTIAYYDTHADAFVEGTVGASMRAILERFLAHVPAGGRVLDWGCGSGRDSLAMMQAGYEARPVDASPVMCEAAADLTGLETRCQTFAELAEEGAYDGIWANSSLLHVPSAELPDVLGKAARALKPSGALYCSFKLDDFEGERNGRWFTDMIEERLRAILMQVPELRGHEFWETADVRPGRSEERWLNCLTFKR